MASNYYPMVSSSPPPLDDGPLFEDDDGDFEFGNFASADMATDTIDKNIDPVQTEEDSAKETFEQCVSNVDRDLSGNNEGAKTISEASVSSECSSHTIKHSDNILLDERNAQEAPQHLHINFGNSDSFEDGNVIENTSVSNIQVPEQPISDVLQDVDSNLFVNDPLSKSDFQNESNQMMNKLIAENDSEVSVAEQLTTKEVLEIDACDTSDVVFVSNNEDVFTRTEVIGDLCFNESSSNVQFDETTAEGNDIACNRQNDDIAAELENTKNEAVMSLPLTNCLDDAADWGHSDSSFDEFTDFQTAPVSYFQDDGCVSSNLPDCIKSDEKDMPMFVDDVNDFDNFATFDENERSDIGMTAPSSFFVDDEFGNFNCASSNQFTEKLADAHAQVTISALLASVFPETAAVDQSMVNLMHLDEAVRCASLCDDPKTLKSLWSHLHDIDNTHALTYHWSHSQSNKKLLHSLRIDARNFLAGTRWNSSMPLFAATLGSDPLEPKKAILPCSDEENAKSILAGDLPTLKFGGTQETAVPPAQFDWGSSGLINPLDGLESEFLGSTSSTEGKLTSAGSINTGSSLLVDKILLQAAKSSSATFFNAHTRRRDSNLSQEATRVLDTLPDLSFMRAKVLMFPIRGAL